MTIIRVTTQLFDPTKTLALPNTQEIDQYLTDQWEEDEEAGAMNLDMEQEEVNKFLDEVEYWDPIENGV